jgi:hypothetical protein
MNKQGNQEWSEIPGVLGPDYLSLVIEWEDIEVLDTSGTPGKELEGATTTRHHTAWDAVDEASTAAVHTATINSERVVARRQWFRRILTSVLAIGAMFAFVQHVRHRHA